MHNHSDYPDPDRTDCQLTEEEAAREYADRLGLPYTPNKYQVGIWNFIANGRGHGVVEAVAGSGKTETIVRGAGLISGDGLFVAFNKSIARMLGDRLAHTSMTCKTVHSHGFAAVRFANRGTRVEVDSAKYRNMVRTFEREVKKSESLFGRKLMNIELGAIDDDGFPRSTILRLLDLARLELVDADADEQGFADALLDLANHHALDLSDELVDFVATCVRRCMQTGKAQIGTVDFTDMVWLPIVNDYRPKTFAWVFVDECQDISKAHLALIKKSCRSGGRMLFVGDRRQAIYGFAGADAYSFQNIVDDTRATVLPLSVCYRCPSNVLDVARDYCPQIEARPDAPAGVVRETERADFISEAHEGDMVLCRVNAPLLSLCFSLIAEGISAAVRGRDIGKGLCKVVDDVCKTIPNFDGFRESLSEWQDDQCRFARERFSDEDAAEARCEYIGDQAECIRIVLARSEAKDADALKNAIEDLFDDDNPSVVLSSVHKAKGLEAERVFIVEPNRLRRPRAKLPWMMEQERNLAYVAYTRAMAELVFIED